MRRCGSLLHSVLKRSLGASLQQRKTGRRKTVRRAPRNRSATISVCDAFGMTIPEARLHRDKLSPDAFDRCIEEQARDILGVEAAGAPSQGNYGASFDRREMRFQGRNSDICKFAEMAARNDSTEKRNDMLLQNAVAFVRDNNHFQKSQTPAGNCDKMKEPVKKGTSAMLHRALKHHGGVSSMLIDRVEKCNTIATAKTGPETSTRTANADVTKKTQGKQRADRRRRRLERVLNREGGVHPCVYQGGCASRGGVALCPFALHPATVCVNWLRHGRCEDAISGCCPWWHGSVSGTHRAELRGGCLFQSKEEDSGDGLLQASCECVAMLLQMLLDVVVAALDEAQFEGDEEVLSAEVVVQRVQMMFSAGKGGTTTTSSIGDLPLHYDAVRGVLSMEWGLAVSAVMADVDTTVAPEEDAKVVGVVGDELEGNESFDAMIARELASLPRGVAEQEERGKEVHDDGEWRLRRALTAFRGYFSVCDEHEAPGARVALCAPLTHWLLLQAVESCGQRGGKTANVTPKMLFEGACAVVLRNRLLMCGIGNTEKNGVADSHHRWSALLLLEQLTLLAHIPASCCVLCHTGQDSARCSLLYTTLLAVYVDSVPSWSGDRVQAQYVGFWVFLQTLLSTTALGILRDGTRLFALVRSAMVDAARQVARDMESHFAGPLLRASGWSAWSDEQMFASQQSVAYTAADYARFHMPTVAHSFMVSALNVFLLHTLRLATHQHQLRRSPVGGVLFSTGRGTEESPQVSLQRERNLRGGVRVRRGLRFYALEALALLSLLQDEANAALVRRQLLVEEFMTRKREYLERCANEVTRRWGKNTGNIKSKPLENDDVHILEKLLPHGSAMVSADALGLLLRALLDGCGPYKALRLAASAIYACRTLRHAARQPMPYVVQGEKTVHKRVRHSGSRWKHIIRVRVPVLRRVDPEVDARERNSAGTRPVGLYLQVNEIVVEEVVRLGLRTGVIGAKLVRGVCEDCVRGSLVDYASSRCLPAPSACDVHENGTIASVFGTRALQAILSIAGVGSRRTQPSRTTGDVIVERRVPPTAMLLEIAVALTPNEDREAHSSYERFCSMDQRGLVNDRVLLVQQYHTARFNFRRAIGNAAAVWLDAVLSWPSWLPRALAASLQAEAERLPAHLALNEAKELAFSRVQAPQTTPLLPTPRTVAQLQDHLANSEKSAIGIGSSSNSSRSRPTHACYMPQCFSAHASDTNMLHRMSWAAIGGVVLVVDEEKLTGTQRLWSQLLLRNTFIIAQHFMDGHDRTRYTQATVRLLLLSDLVDLSEQKSAAVRQSPWCSAVVRGLPQYLALQLHLAEKLHALQANMDKAHEHRRQLLPLLKAAAGLQDIDASTTSAWRLLDPFLALPELAEAWLQASFYNVQHDLLAWLIARIDAHDPCNAVSLAAWITFLHCTGDHIDSFLHIAQNHANKCCTPQQLQQLQHLHALTKSKNIPQSIIPHA